MSGPDTVAKGGPGGARSDAVEALLHPRNVAILGATERQGSWSSRIWESLQWAGFPGRVYPVSRSREAVWGTRAFHSAEDLPEPPDHVVVLLPADAVTEQLRPFAAAGARSATIISGGFGEGEDRDGAHRAKELADLIAEYGMAVSGPNCLGNLCVESRLLTMTERRVPLAENGRIAIVGQSGGVVMAVYRALWDRGAGSSILVTSGNELGLSSADYVDYLARKDGIDVVLAFVESLREPLAFRAACRAATDSGKRVVLVKVGESDRARAAAASHTGSLVGSVAAFDAFMDGTGAVRVASMDELVEAGELLAHIPVPSGSRAGAVVFSGGLKDLVVEHAEQAGVAMPNLSAESVERLSRVLGVGTSMGNPLDVGYIGLTDPAAYLECIRVMRADPAIDFVLIQEELLRFPGNTRKEESLQAVSRMVNRESGHPVAMFSMVSHSVTDYGRALRTEKLPGLPLLQEPTKALRVMASLGRASESARTRPAPEAATCAERADLAAATRRRLTQLTSQGVTTLTEIEAREIIAPYGVTFPEAVLTTSVQAAARAASRLGYPVVLKGLTRQIQHKTEAGLVELGVTSSAELRDAYGRIVSRMPRRVEASGPGEGVLVSRQVPAGTEMIIGITQDPEVGAVVMLGIGGVLAELLQDTVVGMPPIDEKAGHDMVASLRSRALLEGYRSAPVADIPALVAALQAVGQLAADAGDMLADAEINPLAVGSGDSGATALDALMLLR